MTGTIKCETRDDITIPDGSTYVGFVISGFDALAAQAEVKLELMFQLINLDDTGANTDILVAFWQDYALPPLKLLESHTTNQINQALMTTRAPDYYDVPLQYHFAQMARTGETAPIKFLVTPNLDAGVGVLTVDLGFTPTLPTDAELVCLFGTRRASACTINGNEVILTAPVSLAVTTMTEITITSTNDPTNMDQYGLVMPAAGKYTFTVYNDQNADATIDTQASYDYIVPSANKFTNIQVIPGHITEGRINILEFTLTLQTDITTGTRVDAGFILYFPVQDSYGNKMFDPDLGAKLTSLDPDFPDQA